MLFIQESLPTAEVEYDQSGRPRTFLDKVPYLINLLLTSVPEEPESNLTLHTPSYWEVPEVQEGNIHETVFVWMRFLHCAIVPVVIFILNKV